MRRIAYRTVLFALTLCSCCWAGERMKMSIPSSADGTKQPSYVILPDGFDPNGTAVPLLVSLHSWSGDLEQRNAPLEQLAEQRGWVYLFPNFRGRNDNPAACGSELAQQDIVDAVQWAKNRFPIDGRRIYLTGSSGGGHMTMLMAARHPDIWAAASAWVGISDLAAWHKKHAGSGYGDMMEAACGGPPGSGDAVDEQAQAGRENHVWQRIRRVLCDDLPGQRLGLPQGPHGRGRVRR